MNVSTNNEIRRTLSNSVKIIPSKDIFVRELKKFINQRKLLRIINSEEELIDKLKNLSSSERGMLFVMKNHKCSSMFDNKNEPIGYKNFNELSMSFISPRDEKINPHLESLLGTIDEKTLEEILNDAILHINERTDYDLERKIFELTKDSTVMKNIVQEQQLSKNDCCSVC